MKTALVMTLCLVVAGCSPSTNGAGPSSPSAKAKPAAARSGAQKAAARTSTSCEDAIEAQTNAAMLGGALGMMGSFGGFGGRGGMVASQVASTAGNVVTTSQTAKARAGVHRECY